MAPQPKVLVSDSVSEAGLDALRSALDVDYRPKMPKEELLQSIGGYDALMVRSATQVTGDVIESGTRLRVIGRAGVGVDNIDVQAATDRGIIVVNSPEGNTIAAAELAFALLLSLARKIPHADASLRNGEWKREKYVGSELYKKTLGILGLGKIGREVAIRARAFGMTVLALDPYVTSEQMEGIGVEPAELDELLSKSDFVSVHVPLNDQTRGLINRETIARMKDGARIVNCARGGIIDEAALADAIRGGKVAGAALDVFGQEPPQMDLDLLHMEENVVTPHLGASTEEAQVSVAVDVAEQIAAVLNGGVPRSPVNLPPVAAESMELAAPYIELAGKIGRLHTQIADGPLRSLRIKFAGDWEGMPQDAVARSVVAGALTLVLTEPVNMVNAPVRAQQRGLNIEKTQTDVSEMYPTKLIVEAETENGTRIITGTLFGKRDIRITHIDDLPLDLVPEGIMLMTEHRDRPGIVGRLGSLLGEHGINIAGMHVGRTKAGGLAFMIIVVDGDIPETVLKQVRIVEGVDSARVVKL